MKKYIYIAALLSIWTVFSQDLSQGYIANDLTQRPMQPLAKPAYLNAVADPSFPSTSIRRISEANPNGSIVPMYSTIQAWNADESLLIVYAVGSGHRLLNGTDYSFVRDLSDIRPDDVEAVFWHFTDPDILFYMDSSTDDLIRYNVKTQSKTVIDNMRTLSGCSAGLSSGNDVQMMSWDSDVFSFRCGNTSAFYYRISTGVLTEFNITNINYAAPMPFPSGNLFYHNKAVYDANGDFVRDLNISGVEHSCLGKLSNGDDAYFAISFAEGPDGGCLGTLVAHNATTGNCFAVTPTEEYGYSKSGTHISALAHKNSEGGWVAVSSMGYQRDGVQILDQELFIAKVDEFDSNVYRVAHHRSDEDDIDYWGEPHVTISPSGTRLLFGSDWSGSEDGTSVDAYVAELGVYTAPTPDDEDCASGQIIPEYRLDGVWFSGQNELTVAYGTEVVFSMLPNNIGVTVEFPDGTVVGDNYNIGAVTPADNGPYLLTSSEGCTTVIDLTVEEGDSDGDGFFNDVDCDDNDPTVNPGAEEVCDGIDNNCDGLIDDGDAAATCGSVEFSADLLDATYLQGSRNPSPTGPILRAEQGKRVAYLKFDLGGLNAPIRRAELKLKVASDPGYGTLGVYLGSDSNWTENGLNGANRPNGAGSPLATITGTHALGQTKIWDLDIAELPNSGLITLIVKHSDGNDVAFASDETDQSPQLIITTGETTPVDGDGDGFFNDVDCDDNDPTVNPGAEEVCDGIDNNCDGLIDDGDAAATCGSVEFSADLLDATYLQGSRNPSPTGPILRAEQGKRVAYLKFDLGGLNAPIRRAELKLKVASDPGYGTLGVYLGSDSNWTENGLNGANRPNGAGSPLATITGTHALGQTKIWDLDVAELPNSGLITLIVKHSDGNDVAFASDETDQAPQLIITSEGDDVMELANTLNLLPNPASTEIAIGFTGPTGTGAIFVYDLNGKLLYSVPAGEVRSMGAYRMNIENLPNGIYFVKTFDALGIPHQKRMVINR